MPLPLPSLPRWRALRTRVTVGILLTVVLTLWAGTLGMGHFLRQDMEGTISAQQFSTVSLAAREVDRSIRERLTAVENMAAAIRPAMLAEPRQIQDYLGQRLLIPLLFNWGAIVTDREGRAVASIPEHLGRVGTAYGDIAFLRQVLDDGVSRVSDPLRGRRTGQPVVTMAAAIKDGRGQVLGLVLGVTNLAMPNFLDDVSAAKYGNTGDFIITAPLSRVYVTSSDKRRVMQPGPAPGINPVYDRYLGGYEGSGVARSSRGVVELSSSRIIPSTGWLMQSVLPAEEAFAPVREMQRHLILVSLVLTLVAWGVAAWWLRRQLKPLEEASGLLDAMRSGALPRQPLPVRQEDEIGQLAHAFNGLLAAIVAEEAQAAEHAANRRLRKIVSHVPGVVFQYRLHGDGNGSFPFASDAIQDIFGISAEAVEASAAQVRALMLPEDGERLFASMQTSARELSPWRVEYRINHPRDGLKWLLVDAVPERDEDGVITWYGFITDVTRAKVNEAELRIAATTFESQEGIFITDADNRIIRVNRAFSEMTGYSDVEALGRNPSFLKSGRHDQPFYRALWEELAREGCWRGEIWNRRKNGEFYAAWTTISAVRDAGGATTHYVAAFTDVTEHKAAEEQIQRLAFYDPLTNLPNRRLFLDRFDQALAAALRNQGLGALMFLDLDQFKGLNDRYGHIMGDELLVEVARRLCLCLRGVDTVARLGGDEFVVMLQNLEGAEGQEASPAQAARLAEGVAEKIRITLAEPYLLTPRGESGGEQVVRYCCTASIGICLFDGDSPGRDELIRRADVAMYAAKSAGRNTVRTYVPELDGSA